MSAFPFTKMVASVPTGALNPSPSCSAARSTFSPRTLCAKPGCPAKIRSSPGLPGPARVHADFRQRFPFKNVAAYQAHPSVSKYRNSWFAETPSQEITPNPGNPMKNNTLPIKNEPSRERLPRPVRIKEKQPGMHLSSLLPALQVAKILQANFLSFSHGHFWFLQFIRLR